MTVRKAADVTGIAAADFSRIRTAKLDRFTIDRLMAILGRLDQKVEIEVTVRAKGARASPHRGKMASNGRPSSRQWH